MTKMYNPNTGERVDVPDSEAGHRRQDGFIAVGRDDSTETYDPADHNVDDVIAHVEANPDQRETILAAERDGKNRTTLIDALGE